MKQIYKAKDIKVLPLATEANKQPHKKTLRKASRSASTAGEVMSSSSSFCGRQPHFLGFRAPLRVLGLGFVEGFRVLGFL